MLVLRLVSRSIVRTSALLCPCFGLFAFRADVSSASGLEVAGVVVVFELGVGDGKGVVLDAFLLFAYGKSGGDTILT